MQRANFERECIEETCTNEELRETMPQHASYEAIKKRRETYTKCTTLINEDRDFRTLTKQAKKRKLVQCMDDPDQCQINPCNATNIDINDFPNGCKDLIGDYECVCKKGYGGKNCEILVDYCILNPCDHGSCKTGYRSYTCECNRNWEGTDCDIEITDCRRESNARGVVQKDKEYDCVHGKCIDSGGQWECDCTDGWLSGEGYGICDQNENECERDTSPCDQQCIDNIGSYQCNCRMGFIVSSLDDTKCNDIDECQSHNAAGCDQMQGGCNNTIGSFHCYCNDGYELDYLHQKYCNDINECKADNGGCSQDCVNIDGSYECRCSNGYYMEDDKLTCSDLDECNCENLPQKILNNAYNFKLELFILKIKRSNNI